MVFSFIIFLEFMNVCFASRKFFCDARHEPQAVVAGLLSFSLASVALLEFLSPLNCLKMFFEGVYDNQPLRIRSKEAVLGHTL